MALVLISWSGSGDAMRSPTEMSQNSARNPARAKLLLPALHYPICEMGL